MKAACLVCKEFRGLIMPYLYRHVRIQKRQLNDRLKRALDPKHTGLQLIRTLSITNTWAQRFVDHEIAVLHGLILTIPRNSLNYFR